jgi:predicted alpha/beta-hydrolase family hydrolase
VLGHGAGGDVDAPDLLGVRDAALAASVAVARITQPYRVAGRRAPSPATQLDEAWLAALATLTRPVRATALSRLPLIVGGRSSGARVACRTAGAAGAQGILALAFPLHPPGRPERSRAGELLTGLPTLVVNGDRDPFGVPDAGPGIEVCLRHGQRHDLRGDPSGTGAAVVDWLARHGWA